jgi:hypothetical protein
MTQMMKKICLTIGCLFVAIVTQAQILNPVHWSYAAKKTGNNGAIIYIKAVIDNGWHIYSTRQKDGGPVKTSFSFAPSKDYELSGVLMEPTPVTRYEKVFDIDVSYFENSVIFQQKLKMNVPSTLIKGNLRFMVCNDKQCLPPETVNFEIPIK